MNKERSTKLPTLIFVTLLIGVCSGLGGMFLALLLHYIQHVAFGYSPSLIISDESFLEGVSAASSQRRIIVLLCCGLIAGWGWWAVYRFGKPLVSIKTAVGSNKPHLPYLTTIAHILLQIITIAMGSPLGREVAPREAGALFACWISNKAGLSIRDTQIMVACGAGAGLAAVYNVPFGGAMFILEALLCTLSWEAVLPAITTSVIAVVVSWIGLGNEPLYHIPIPEISYSLVIWSIVVGPFLGIYAYWFIRTVMSATAKANHNWQQPLLCFINFTFIGVLAVYFPALLGNGKSPAELEFSNAASIELTAALLILRTLITWSSFRAGAHGGVLMPSIATGALLAAFLGALWNLVWPGTSLGAFAVIGATAFLAASNRMPITAIILLFEFTRVNFNFLIPMLFAVAGSIGMYGLCQKILTPPSSPTKT